LAPKILKSSVGCVAMGFFSWATMHAGLEQWVGLATHERLARGLELLVAISGGAGLYMLIAKFLHMEEWEPFWAQLSSRHAAVEVPE